MQSSNISIIICKHSGAPWSLSHNARKLYYVLGHPIKYQ